MSLKHNASIHTDGLCFAWAGYSLRCWDRSSSTHRDMVSGAVGTKVGANTLSYVAGSTNASVGSVNFSSQTTSQSCYISFPSADITVPTGATGTWMWIQKAVDHGDMDHPNFGKETTGSWNGANGFVFGTGWGTDGPRWGIGGTAYDVYNAVLAATGDYRFNAPQIYAVTYQQGVTNGLKTYLCDSNGRRLVDQRTPTNVAIGSSGNELRIGATNVRAGNWNGDMDAVYMWTTALTETQIMDMYRVFGPRYGI